VRYRLDLQRPVERSLIEDCIRLACYAPTQSNTQEYRWVVVDDRELRSRVGECYRAVVEENLRAVLAREVEHQRSSRVTKAALYLAQHMAEVPVMVLPCYDMAATARHYADIMDRYDPSRIHTVYASVYPAVWSFQLACRSRGLGTTMTTAHLRNRETMAEILGLPDSWVQTCLIPVAHTIGEEFSRPDRRPVEEVLVWNQSGMPSSG
jgi:nitroreductase